MMRDSHGVDVNPKLLRLYTTNYLTTMNSVHIHSTLHFSGIFKYNNFVEFAGEHISTVGAYH